VQAVDLLLISLVTAAFFGDFGSGLSALKVAPSAPRPLGPSPLTPSLQDAEEELLLLLLSRTAGGMRAASGTRAAGVGLSTLARHFMVQNMVMITYHTLTTRLLDGCTPGKLLLQIRVARLTFRVDPRAADQARLRPRAS
jgi:hypothetical protein